MFKVRFEVIELLNLFANNKVGMSKGTLLKSLIYPRYNVQAY